MWPVPLPWRRPLLLVVAISLIVATYTPSVAGAPLKEHFSTNDADAYVEVALRTLADGAATTPDKDYAVRLLNALGKEAVATGYKSSACSTASVGLADGDLAGIHHGISLRVGVGCAGEAASAEARGVIEQAIQVRAGYCSLGGQCIGEKLSSWCAIDLLCHCLLLLLCFSCLAQGKVMSFYYRPCPSCGRGCGDARSADMCCLAGFPRRITETKNQTTAQR